MDIPNINSIIEEVAQDSVERKIVDRTKLRTRDSYPNFILTDLQIHYYQSMYDQIIGNGTVIENVDSNGLGMLAMNLALVDECTFSIQSKGMTMEYAGDRKMVLKRNPALDVLKDAQAAVRFYLREFNMTPASRNNKTPLMTGSPGVDNKDKGDGFDEV